MVSNSNIQNKGQEMSYQEWLDSLKVGNEVYIESNIDPDYKDVSKVIDTYGSIIILDGYMFGFNNKTGLNDDEKTGCKLRALNNELREPVENKLKTSLNIKMKEIELICETSDFYKRKELLCKINQILKGD